MSARASILGSLGFFGPFGSFGPQALLLFVVSVALPAQETVQEPDRPLPDVPTLMREVAEHQHAAEAIQRNYIFHEDARRDDEKGRQVEHQEYDVFWLNGVQVHKLTRKDGRELTDSEKRKEDERIDKEVAKAKERRQKAEAKGEQTDSHGHEEVTVSRLLTLGQFTSPRRVRIGGRDTIAVDYIGDPKAKTRNRFEEVIRDLTGTVWVDEQDRSIVQLEGHFINNFKIGGGLLMNIRKDTSFSVQQRKINGEVWLPSQVTGQGAARVLLFANFNGSVHVTNSDYRRFKATSTILPGMATVQEDSAPESTTAPASTSEAATAPR